MKNLFKLSGLAAFCFGLIVLGACSGGDSGGGGGYQATVNGTVYSASGTVNASSTDSSTSSTSSTATGVATITSPNPGALGYTVTDGNTYFQTATGGTWQICTNCTTSTSP
jgi:hypothetical protein